MRALTLHRFLLRFALSSTSVFAWLFLFQYFYFVSGSLGTALARVALLYALSATVTCLLTPYAARALVKGARRSLFFALLFLIAALVMMGSLLSGFWGAGYSAIAVALFGLCFGIYRALYWVPYTIESAGAKPATRYFWAEPLIALAPGIVGVLIASVPSTPLFLFYLGAGLVVLSAIPLVQVTDRNERFSWPYRQTFHELMAREHRSYVTRAILEGICGTALLLFWPLAILLLVGWSYAALGVILSLAFLAALFLRAPIRMLLRRMGSPSPILTSVLAVTPWFFRLSVASPLGVILTDSYFYTTTSQRHGIDPFVFEQFSDGGSLLDEYTALKEMALCIGKITLCVIAVGLAAYSLPVTFILVFCIAATASLWLAFGNQS